jgi:hypothetical protein
MTTVVDTEIVKRTELGGNVVVLTIRWSDAFLLRPYQTFAIAPTTRYATRLSDATCVSVALHQHEQLVRQLAIGSKEDGNELH